MIPSILLCCCGICAQGKQRGVVRSFDFEAARFERAQARHRSNLSIKRESNDDSTHQASHHRNFQATSQRHEVYNNHRRRSHAFGRRVYLLCRGGKDRRRDCGATRHSEWKDGEYLFCTGFNFGYSNAGLFSILNAIVDIQPGVRVEWSRVYVFDLPD